MEDKRNNGPQIVVDDGYERVAIVNRRGEELGAFWFMPTDTGLVDRFEKLSNGFDEIVEPLKDIDISPDGTSDMEALREAERRLCDALDETFGEGFSEASFTKVRPFSPVNGAFYVENVLNGVGSFITSRFGREVKKINSRVAKYTRDFQRPNGKHAGGRNRK